MYKKIIVPFEGRDVALNLPDSWNIKAEMKPRPTPKIDDITKALINGLDNPIGCEPLNLKNLSDKKIVMVIDDISRPTPTHLFFNDLLTYLFNHGAQKNNILIIIALGIHRDMTEEELEDKLGTQDIGGLKWVNHNCRDINENIELGTTKRGTVVRLNRHLMDADLILCVGLIEPHPLLGFGGGLKMILPGLAHEETIAQNHMQGVSFERFNYIGEYESPMRLDLEEAALMLKKEIFIVNVILNHEQEICRFVCGDAVKAQREGAKMAESINANKITKPADVAIVTSNPMNTDLRQGLKCIANIEKGVKEGGLILALVECRYGIGDINIPSKNLCGGYGILRFILKLLGKRRLLWFVDKIRKGCGIEERFLLHFSMQVARKNRIFIYSNKLPAGIDKRIGLFRQFTDLNEMTNAAARSLPAKANVYIYPYGGVSYAYDGDRSRTAGTGLMT